MNRVECSLKCPSCSQQYSNKEYRGSRTPRILQCGHTCCEVCIKSRSAQTNVCTCPVCKASQPVPDPNSVKNLLVDSYILGSQLQFGKELPDWFGYKNGEAFYTVAKTTSSSKEEPRKVPCDECGEQSASCRCDTCPSNYCKLCFEQVHRIGKTMRRHKPLPLQRNPVPSPQDALCEEHQRSLEFYCQEDNVLICSFCVVMGGHRPHTVVAVADQNKAAMEEIKPALEEGLRSFQGLKKTEKKLEKIRFGIDSYFQMAADNVVTHFHHLHGLLQLRCWQLLEEIKKANAEYARDLQEQSKDISSSLQEFLLLQKEAGSLLSSASSTSANAAFVLERLKRFKDLPCFLTSDPTSYHPIEQMQFDPALPGALKCYGDVQFALLEKLNIVPLRDLPEDYIQGEGDDTDTESSSSYYENNTTEDSSHVSVSQTSEDTGSNGRVAESHDTLNNKRVVVSHIRDPCHFYVQLCHMVSKLRKMQKDINDYCASPESRLNSYADVIQVGSIYLAQFGMDNSWYRCRVLRTQPSTVDIVDGASLQQGKNLVEVFYYDYGNSEMIPSTRLRLMHPEFKALPPMAIKCSLYNLVPSQGDKTWRKSAIGMFARLTVNKNIILKEVERLPETLFVDLMDADTDDWTSVSDALVFSEMAFYHLPDNRSRTARQSSVLRRQYYPPTEFHVGQVLNVLVSAVKSPHEVYIQECGSNQTYLQKMSADLQEHCETKKSEGEAIYVPHVGMVCLAYNHRDEKWYRARVSDLPGGSRVDVCFVDYGNRENVRVTSIRRIPDQFMKLPPQAIPVSMADIVPVENDAWSKEAKNRLTKLTINQELCMKVHTASNQDKLPSVSLYIPGKKDKDICVNSILVKEKLASCTGPISLLVDVPNVMPRKVPPEKISLVHVHRAACKASVQPNVDLHPEHLPQIKSSPGRLTAANALLAAVARQSTSPLMSPIPQTAAPKGPGEGFIAVLITLVQSPASFFVRYRDDKKKWRKLVAETQEEFSSASGPADKEIQWQCGQWCAVDHNGLWHRAKVVTVADHVEVCLVDTGEVVIPPRESLTPIPDCLTEQPPFAHKCHLAEIIPAGGSSNWSKTAMEFFEELLQKADGIYIQKMGEVLSDSLPVDLLLEHVKAAEALEPMKRTHKSVRETLKEHGYAFFPKVASRVKTPMNSPTADIVSAPKLVTTPEPSSAAVSDVEGREHSSKESPLELTNAESPSEGEHHGGNDAIKTTPVSVTSDIAESDGSEQSSAKCLTAELDSAEPYASPSVAVPKEPYRASSSQGDASSNEEHSSDATLHAFFEPSTSKVFGAGDADAVGETTERNSDADDRSEGGKASGEEEQDVEYSSDEDSLPRLLTDEPVFEWKKRDFPNEKQMMVMPSHIDENAVIYVQLLGDGIATYKDMKAELNRDYSSRPPQPLRTVRRGQACIARYVVDHMYYRAKVLGVGEAGVEVQFVDYGTIEFVNPDAVFTDLVFEEIPVLCLEVELYGLKPFSTTGSWPLKVLDTIHYTIVEHNCSMVVKERPTENTRAKVHFFLPDGVALHDFLLETGLACKDESIQPSKKTAGDSKNVSRQSSAEDEGDAEWPYQICHPPEEGIFPVVVSNILSFNTVCIQFDKITNPSMPEEKLINAMLDSFLAMMKVMPEVASAFEPLTAPTVGMACCCQYSYDHSWYRALVRSVSEKEVTVLYVDYGNSESVPLSSLRVLPEEYMDIPMQAVVCALHGVTPVADTEEVIAAMVDILHDGQEQFLARVKNAQSDVIEIDILNSSLELVYQPLADRNLITINRNT